MSELNPRLSNPYRGEETPLISADALLDHSTFASVRWLVLLALSVAIGVRLALEPRWYEPSLALDLVAAIPLIGPGVALQVTRLLRKTRVRVDASSGEVRISARAFNWRLHTSEISGCRLVCYGSAALLFLTTPGRDTLVFHLSNDATKLLTTLSPIVRRASSLRFRVRNEGTLWYIRTAPLVLAVLLHVAGIFHGPLANRLYFVGPMLYYFAILPLLASVWLFACCAGLLAMRSTRIDFGPMAVANGHRSSIAYGDIREVNERSGKLLIRHCSPSTADERELCLRADASGLSLRVMAAALRAAVGEAREYERAAGGDAAHRES